MTQKRHKIAVIAFDGITPFHLSVPSLVFRDAAAFDLKVCSADPPPLRTTAGFDIATAHTLKALAGADIVIVPTWHDDCRPASVRADRSTAPRPPSRRAHRRLVPGRLSAGCKPACWTAAAPPRTGRTPIR